jgi:hypothetical protein
MCRLEDNFRVGRVQILVVRGLHDAWQKCGTNLQRCAIDDKGSIRTAYFDQEYLLAKHVLRHAVELSMKLIPL